MQSSEEDAGLRDDSERDASEGGEHGFTARREHPDGDVGEGDGMGHGEGWR